MTNLLPGVALWRAGRKKLGGVLGGFAILFLVIAALLVIFGPYRAEVGSIIDSGREEGLLGRDLQNLFTALSIGAVTLQYTITAYLAWLSWGFSLWLMPDDSLQGLRSRWQKLLAGLISPGIFYKVHGSFTKAKKVHTTWMFWVTVLSLLIFHTVLMRVLPSFTSGEVPMVFFLYLVGYYLWPFFVFGIGIYVLYKADRAILLHEVAPND